MSFDTRNNSAMMKRAEQLKRWEESETNREPSVPKAEKGRKIKFSSGCVFLAACLAGDKEEVVYLLENGADINTANVDGLTALHQACIDDNLDMVEFLVEHGADINRQDNEGWTPLHATASCGFVSIARYLVEHGADISAVNSDGELAVDLAVDIAHLSPMIEYMQKLVAEHNIDCDKARRAEEEMMLNDAKRWLRSDASEADNPHPKTGATALHVAAAKGYKKVLSLLLAGRANVDKQDNDGWTPLHAASHWGQKESAEMLVDAMADMDIRNYAGQTCIDVAERKMVKFLEDLRANNKRMKRRPSSQISRISDTIENHIENTPTKFIRVEVKPDTKDPVNEHSEDDGLSNLERITESDETDSELTDSTESSHSTSISEAEDDKPKLVSESNKIHTDTGIEEDAPWRRGSAARTRNQPESPPKNQVPEKDVKPTETDVILRRTQSFENDEKFYQKYNELRARIKANSCPILPATQNPNVLGTVNTPIQNYSVQRSASLKDHRYFRKPVTSPPASPNTPVATPNTTTPTTPTTPNTTPIRRSFVPPVRDEESETQRKAHAKRVRETRRSTQGVTLDEIKSAEELVKKKNSTMNNNNNTSTESQNTPPSSTTITTTPSSPQQQQLPSPQPPASSSATSAFIITTTAVATVATATPLDSTTMTTTPTSPTAPINDRVPSTTVDYETESVPTTKQSSNEDDGEEEISATFTLSFNRTKPIHLTDDKIAEQIHSWSPTPPSTPPPPPIKSPTNSQPPPAITIEEHKDVDEKENADEDQEVEEDEDEEVNDEEEANKAEEKPTSPVEVLDSPRVDIVQETGANADEDEEEEEEEEEEVEEEEEESSTEEEKVNGSTIVPSSPTNSKTPTNVNEKTEDQVTITTDDETATTMATTATATVILNEKPEENQQLTSPMHSPRMRVTATSPSDSPTRLRDKRSLFDIDNANSLSLAEKLRNEANKYTNEEMLEIGELTKSTLPPTAITTTKPTSSSSHDSDNSDRDSVVMRKSESTPSSPLHMSSAADRRPSWRLKFDSGCKFKLEDASSGNTFPPNNSTIIPSAPAVIAAANLSSSIAQRRMNTTNAMNTSNQQLSSLIRPVSAPVGSMVSSNSITPNESNDRSRDFTTNNSESTLLSRRTNNGEDKENDKENDNRSALATQAVIQRRRKPKRRSTGVVHIDMDDLDPERQDSAGDNEEKEPVSSHRRSLSSSRVPSSTTGSLYSYNGSSVGGPSSYTSATRPLSTGYYQNSSSAYQSPYANIYSSRDNLYSNSSSSNRNGGSYYTNGNQGLSRQNSANKSYTSNYNNNSQKSSPKSMSSGGNGGYESRYSSNPYNSERYISPYSSYDNGITTAGLSLSMPGSRNYQSPPKSKTSTGSSAYTNSPSSRSTTMLKNKSLSSSNNSLNSYPLSSHVSSSSNGLNSISSASTAGIVPRSNSLREQERKSRNRSRSRSIAQRSLSASSEKSEGYESGNERSSRSRLGSTVGVTTDTEIGDTKSNSKDKTENGELIDYKALWEASKLENEKLKQQLKKKDDEILQARATVERFTNATTKNSLSEIEKRERRAMERKLSEMEEELKQLEVFKTENQRLKEENGALIRVISKLSK